MRTQKSLVRTAKAGDSASQHKLGRLLLARVGVKAQHEAIHWLVCAANTNPRNALYLFDAGLALWWAEEVLRDSPKALSLIEASAKLGNIDAMYFAASELAQGDLVPRNAKKSFYWYRRAAKKGHGEAQYNLAIMFLEGDGTEKDLDAFKRWIKKSAARGESLAIETIVNCYRQGIWGFRKSDRWMQFWRQKESKLRDSN